GDQCVAQVFQEQALGLTPTEQPALAGGQVGVEQPDQVPGEHGQYQGRLHQQSAPAARTARIDLPGAGLGLTHAPSSLSGDAELSGDAAVAPVRSVMKDMTVSMVR